MKDMTQGSVTRHLLEMSAFIAVSMLIQTLYLLADLYWVGSLGKEAIAAVGLCGNLMMVVMAITQALGVGTTTLISQAAGQKDQPRAELAFNQSLVLSLLVAVVLAVCAFAVRDQYCQWLSADAATAELARSYLLWFIPGLMAQFPLVALGSALRATGIMKPTVAIQAFTVLINMVLAPLLIFGVGPFPKLGVAGAALARVGARVMQAMFLPVIAIAFAVAPVVGQNFGGRRGDRVRSSYYSALGITSAMMLLLTIVSHFAGETLIRFFSTDAGVIAFGSEYLKIISLNFVAMGIVFTSSSVFQGIGNTLPPLVSSMTRLVLFALPATLLSRVPGFQIRHVWYMSVASILLQAAVNLLLLRREFQRKLTFADPADLSGQPAMP